MENASLLGDGIFWALVFSVFAALAGGAAVGLSTSTVPRALAACTCLAILICAVSVYLSIQADFPPFWPVFCLAAFLFSLVMSTATSLVARRVQRAREARLDK